MKDPCCAARREQLVQGKSSGAMQIIRIFIEWSKGLWLGHARDSNEVLVGTESGAVRAYRVNMTPGSEIWMLQ